MYWVNGENGKKVKLDTESVLDVASFTGMSADELQGLEQYLKTYGDAGAQLLVTENIDLSANKTCGEKLAETPQRVGASVANTGVAITHGVANFAEHVGDTFMTLGANYQIYQLEKEAIKYGLVGDEKNQEESEYISDLVKKVTMAEVSQTIVDDAFTDFYTNNSAGQKLNETAYTPFKYGEVAYGIAQGIGENAPIILASTATSGFAAASTATSGLVASNAGRGLAIALAGANSYGANVQEMWNMNANSNSTTDEKYYQGAVYATSSAIWDMAQWALGFELNDTKVIAGSAFNAAAARVGTDVGTAAVDPYFKAAVAANIRGTTFDEEFTARGGVQAALTNATVAGILSGGSEVIDLLSSKQNQTDITTIPETPDVDNRSLANIDPNGPPKTGVTERIEGVTDLAPKVDLAGTVEGQVSKIDLTGKVEWPAPKVEIADVPQIETPKVEIADVPQVETPKVEIADVPQIETPKVEIADVPQIETPKVEIADVPQIETPKVEIADVSQVETRSPFEETSPRQEMELENSFDAKFRSQKVETESPFEEMRSPFEEMSPRQETELQNPYEAELRSQIQELKEKIRGSYMENVEMDSNFQEIKKTISGICEELQEKGINEIGLRDSMEELGNSVGTAEWELNQDRADFLREIQRIKEEFEKNIDTNEDEKIILLRIQESANTRNDYAVKKYKEIKDKIEECIQKNNYLRRNSNEYYEVGTTLNQGLRKIDDIIEELEGLEKKRYESIDENIAQMESTLRKKIFDDESQSLKSHKQELTNAEVEDIVSEHIKKIVDEQCDIVYKDLDTSRTKRIREDITKKIKDGTINLANLTREEFQTELLELDRKICEELLEIDYNTMIKDIRSKTNKDFSNSEIEEKFRAEMKRMMESGMIDVTMIGRKEYQRLMLRVREFIVDEIKLKKIYMDKQAFLKKTKEVQASIGEAVSSIDKLLLEYNDEGTYGVNQGMVHEKNITQERIKEFVNIIKEKYRLSYEDANKIVSCMDTEETGGGICTYGSFGTSMFVKFANKSEIFKTATGIDLIRFVDGKKVANYDELLITFYVDENIDGFTNYYCEKDENGKYNWGRRLRENLKRSAFSFTNSLSGKQTIYTDAINRWFKKKKAGIQISVENNFTVNSNNLELTRDKIKKAIEEGKLVIYSCGKKRLNRDVDPLPMDMKFYTKDSYFSIQGNHSVFVTGDNNYGLLANSWGRRGIITYEDIVDDSHWSNVIIFDFVTDGS